ncbi:hypothetical protein [Alteromonas sp. S005]|uniref:hypothetical protein n=1 Tax=Alteromonas sp. S005 TaxID=3117400 RepID=UPI002FE3A5EA
MDRHSAATLAWRFAEIKTQKNRLKGRFLYLLLKEEMVPVGGLDGTDLRPTRLRGDLL